MKINIQSNQKSKETLEKSAFLALQSITPSQKKAYTWYKNKNSSPLSPFSKFSVPLFGSVFAASLAFIMIITGQSAHTPVATFSSAPLETARISLEAEPALTPKTTRTQSITPTSEPESIIVRIDTETKMASRIQTEDNFTDSLAIETSLSSLLE